MRSSAIVLAVSAILLVAGAASAYCLRYDADPELSVGADGSYSIEVGGLLPADVTYRILSDTNVPERIYFYLDDDRSGGLVSFRDQKIISDATESMLSDRGYRSVERVDAEGLAGIIDDPAIASKSGLLFFSGVIPDTIYPDDEHNGLDTWFSNGGTVYWSGPDMGLYRGLPGGESEEAYGVVFGEMVNFCEDEDCIVGTHSDISSEMGFSNYCANYGLRADYDATPSRVLGLYDEFTSLSVASMGAGRVYVLGNYITDIEVENLASFLDMVVSGITENTQIVESGSFRKGYGSESFPILTPVNPGDSVYVSVGDPVSREAVCFRV